MDAGARRVHHLDELAGALRGGLVGLGVLRPRLLFRVSYMTVLHRLVETGRETPDVWRAFQHQHRERFGKTLRRIEEPDALEKSEFAWDWRRSGEPAGLSEQRLRRRSAVAPRATSTRSGTHLARTGRGDSGRHP